MSRFGTLGTQLSDDSGSPLISGLINFFEPGTTTRKNTYSDVNLTTANSNPLVLTAAGRLPSDVYYSGSIDARLTTSDGVIVEIKSDLGGSDGDVFNLWSSALNYSADDIVVGSDGFYYRSIASNNEGNDPTAIAASWEQIKFLAVWNTNVSYIADDVAQGSDGYLYSCVVANSGNDPISDDGTNWRRSSKSEYEVGDVALSADETRFTTPTWLPCDNNSYNTTTYADLYAKLGNVQVDGLIADPASAPVAYVRDISFSSNNDLLAAVHQTSPHITTYSRSGDTFTKLSNPSTLPSGTGYCCEYDLTGTYLTVGSQSSPFITIYKISGTTHTKLTNPATLPTGSVYDVSWDSTSTYLSVVHSTSPFITIYKRSGDTFTKLTNPVTLPPSTAYACEFDSSGVYLAVGHATTPFMTIYKRSGDTFTKLDDPATLPTQTADSVAWSPDGTMLAINNGNSSLGFYAFASDVLTSFDPEIANYLPTSGIETIKFSRDGRYFLMLGTSNPGYLLFSVVGDSFIKAELDTTKDVNDNYYSADFGENDDYLVLGDTNSPYLTFFKGMPLTPKVTADENGQVRGYINTGL